MSLLFNIHLHPIQFRGSHRYDLWPSVYDACWRLGGRFERVGNGRRWHFHGSDGQGGAQEVSQTRKHLRLSAGILVLVVFNYMSGLKTLFNIVEAPFEKLLNFDVCVVWWCSDESRNSQEYRSFEIYVVTIKISMTEYHHWINRRAYRLF